jgi:outer membrane biosynthesis protein TonB
MIRRIVVLAVAVLILAPAAAAQSAPQQAQAQGGTTYLEFQVETPVSVRRAVEPVYPSSLLREKVTGEVLVQFVVNESGNAVRTAVRGTKFRPAQFQGTAVRQVVQLPFAFAVR